MHNSCQMYMYVIAKLCVVILKIPIFHLKTQEICRSTENKLQMYLQAILCILTF